MDLGLSDMETPKTMMDITSMAKVDEGIVCADNQTDLIPSEFETPSKIGSNVLTFSAKHAASEMQMS